MMPEKSKAKKLSIISQRNQVIIEIGNLIYFVARVVSIIERFAVARNEINNEKTVSETSQL